MEEQTPRYILIKDVPYIYVHSDDLTGNIDDIPKKLNRLKDQLKSIIDTWIKEGNPITPFSQYALIEIERNYDYDGSTTYALKCFRLETPEEVQERLSKDKQRKQAAKKAAQTRKAATEKAQRTLYETLKKKFEP